MFNPWIIDGNEIVIRREDYYSHGMEGTVYRTRYRDTEVSLQQFQIVFLQLFKVSTVSFTKYFVMHDIAELWYFLAKMLTCLLKVAVKLVKDPKQFKPELIEKLARLNHRNIVTFQ